MCGRGVYLIKPKTIIGRSVGRMASAYKHTHGAGGDPMVITKRVTSRRSRSQKSVRRVTKIASTGSAGGVEVHPSKTVVVVVMVISIRRRRRREGRKACERAWRKNGLEKIEQKTNQAIIKMVRFSITGMAI